MSANMKLEPGIKALVIGYNSNPHNLGKVVTLKAFYKKGEVVPWGTKSLTCTVDIWYVEGENLLKMSRKIFSGEEICTIGSTGIFSAHQLMPIRPEEDPLQVTDEIKQEIKV